MSIQYVTGKLGNMRKAVEWIVYPVSQGEAGKRLIQSDNRIALVELATGRTVVSSGKGGHPGFEKLSPEMGGRLCECPAEMLSKLNEQPAVIGPVQLSYVTRSSQAG